MNETLKIELRRKILNEYTSDNYEIRNEIYLLLKDDLISWIKAILGSWGKYEDEGEILSLSFEAFLFAIKYCESDSFNKSKFMVDFHFYRYTKYFLLIQYAKKEVVHLPIDELRETFSYVKSDINIEFENFLTLLQFRDVIPEKYQIVWDDACHSLSKDNRDRMKSKNVGMEDGVYHGIKNCFVPIIKFILKK